MTDESVRPEFLAEVLRAYEASDFPALTALFEQASPAEHAAAVMTLVNTTELRHDRWDRIAPLYEIVAPYMRAGARTWGDVLDRLEPADRERFDKALTELWPGDL